MKEAEYEGILGEQQSSEGGVKGAHESVPLPYLRAVAAGSEQVSLGRLLMQRVVLPLSIVSIAIGVLIDVISHWKPPVGPATLI